MSHYFIGYLSHTFNFQCNKNLCQIKKIRTLNYSAVNIRWLYSLRGELGLIMIMMMMMMMMMMVYTRQLTCTSLNPLAILICSYNLDFFCS